MQNSAALHYWTLGLQFVNLFQAGVFEAVARNNCHVVKSAQPLRIEEYDNETRWSDFNVAVPLLFSLFHGVELILKGFYQAHGKSVPKHHKLSQLLEVFGGSPGCAEIKKEIEVLLTPVEGSVLHEFFAKNSVSMDQWYEALKYPELHDGTVISHLSLKYKEESGLKDFFSLSQSLESIRIKVVAYGRASVGVSP
jgi:hypothetical protein